MKRIFWATLMLITSAAAYALPTSRLFDMPRDPRADSACISKTTADTAGGCPRQVLASGKNQAIEDYSPVYHKN